MNLDHASTALLLMDLQNEMVDPKGAVGGGGLAALVAERKVLENARSALDAARAAELAVVHVRLGFRADYSDALSVAPRIDKLKSLGAAVLGSWGSEIHDSVAPSDDELVITKQCVNPFFNTNLMSWLHHNGITCLVLGGVATNLVVESTARAADDAGFQVVVLEDCCASPNPDWHRFSVENLLPLFGEVTTSQEFTSALK